MGITDIENHKTGEGMMEWGAVQFLNKVSRKDIFPEKRHLTDTQGWRRRELCRDQGRALQQREGKCKDPGVGRVSCAGETERRVRKRGQEIR